MKRLIYPLLLVLTAALVSSCLKKNKRINLYDSKAEVSRDYTLVFDHIEVNDEETNDNGLLEAGENVTLHIFLKNNGPDPCLIKEGTIETVEGIAPLAIYQSYVNQNYNDGSFFGLGDSLGYEVRYIDPGKSGYIKVSLGASSWGGPDEDVPVELKLTDYDGDVQTLVFDVHIE